jgi:hypothetical protein
VPVVGLLPLTLIKEAVEQEEIGNDKGTSKKLELLLSGRLPTFELNGVLGPSYAGGAEKLGNVEK